MTGTGTGMPNPNFVIFLNELSSGGGAFEFPGGDNQDLSFADSSDTTISPQSIRYTWNGGTVLNSGVPQHAFVGFDLMHTPTQATYASTPGVNLTSRAFMKLTFFARGTLSANTLMKIEVAAGTPQPCLSLSTNGTDDDPLTPCGRTAQLTANWQSYVIALPVGSLNPVKDFFKATYIYTGGGPLGNGGTVYFDKIEYEP